MTTAPIRQPFIYGRPVRGVEFIGREPELRTIINRLLNGESTAIVGEPHIGKTSLLLHIARPEVRLAAFGTDDKHYTLVSSDLHSISNDYNAQQFWLEALEPLTEMLAATPRGTALLKQTAESQYSRRALENIFNYLGNDLGHRLVLLLDEFDNLLVHNNFKDAAFFALLRSLSTRTGGLALVTASRFSIAEMNERGRGLLDTGSPFFNNMIEVRLRPFTDKHIGILLNRAAPPFTVDERRFVRRVAGGHPFLLQAMCAALAEFVGEARSTSAAESFYDRIAYHFDDLWDSMDDRTRTAAVILSLVEIGGRAQGRDFAFGEIENVPAFGPELKKLTERGLAERASEGWQFDWDNLLVWRGERWTISAQAFTWWVRDVVIAETREVTQYADWLTNKRYKFLLTEQQWAQLKQVTSNLPEWAVQGVGGLARALFDELLKRKP